MRRLRRRRSTPDVVIFRGNARQIMLVSEAARRAGVFETGRSWDAPPARCFRSRSARPTRVTSVGCIGNRVYTGLADDELYIAVPGAAIERVLAEIDTIVNANVELEKFHRARASELRR